MIFKIIILFLIVGRVVCVINLVELYLFFMKKVMYRLIIYKLIKFLRFNVEEKVL